jgi:hypothetical protein
MAVVQNRASTKPNFKEDSYHETGKVGVGVDGAFSGAGYGRVLEAAGSGTEGGEGSDGCGDVGRG